MDVLRPPLLCVGGRVYRSNPVREPERYDEEEEDESGTYRDCPDEADDSLQVDETENGFRCSLEMPSAFFKYIIGRKGDTKRKLESDTRCSVTIPRVGTEGPVVVRGESRGAVRSACARVALLLADARAREPWTHFVGMPLGAAPLSDALQRLADAACSGACARSRGLHVSMFQAPCRLHLTLGTLVLLGPAEVERARGLLASAGNIVREVIGAHPLRVALRGLEFMNDDPAMVDVLYAKIHSEDDRLQTLADRLVEHFVSSGLMVRERDRVKLHATVVNTLYRRGDGRAPAEPRPPRGRESFDAREMLKEFGGFDFGELCVPALHIYQRGSSDPSGAYLTCASLPLPGGPDHQ